MRPIAYPWRAQQLRTFPTKIPNPGPSPSRLILWKKNCFGWNRNHSAVSIHCCAARTDRKTNLNLQKNCVTWPLANTSGHTVFGFVVIKCYQLSYKSCSHHKVFKCLCQSKCFVKRKVCQTKSFFSHICKARHSDRTLQILNAFLPKRPYLVSLKWKSQVKNVLMRPRIFRISKRLA